MACSTPATPPWKEPRPTVATPTWWPSTSAASLSLTESTRSTIWDSGALWTSATGAAPAPARCAVGRPVTTSPAAPSSAAK